MLRWEVYLYEDSMGSELKIPRSLLLATWFSEPDALDWIRSLSADESTHVIDDEYLPYVFIVLASLFLPRLRHGIAGSGSERSGSQIMPALSAMININSGLFNCAPSDKLCIEVWWKR